MQLFPACFLQVELGPCFGCSVGVLKIPWLDGHHKVRDERQETAPCY